MKIKFGKETKGLPEDIKRIYRQFLFVNFLLKNNIKYSIILQVKKENDSYGEKKNNNRR